MFSVDSCQLTSGPYHFSDAPLFRPLSRMLTPPPEEQPEESAYDREVRTIMPIQPTSIPAPPCSLPNTDTTHHPARLPSLVPGRRPDTVVSVTAEPSPSIVRTAHIPYGGPDGDNFDWLHMFVLSLQLIFFILKHTEGIDDTHIKSRIPTFVSLIFRVIPGHLS